MFWGGVQQQKRQRTSCDFPGGMIFFVLFCSLFEDILLTKSGKNNKKEQKRSIKIKKDQNHDLFCSFLRTHFWPNWAQKRRFWTCFEKEQKRTKKTKDILGFSRRHDLFCCWTPPWVKNAHQHDTWSFWSWLSFYINL